MEMKEEWLMPGAVVPVDAETTAALVAEIKRLIGVVGDMALNMQPAQKPVAQVWRYYFIQSSAIGNPDVVVGPCFTDKREAAFGVGCFAQTIVSERKDVQLANARLIAAAPELLAFVEEYMEAFENGMAGDSYLHRIARAAIAKAQGESNE